jgi:hypothetical protein
MARQEIIGAIRALADDVEALAEGLANSQLRWHSGPDQWSILEVCCHLRDAAEIEGLRIRRLASEDNPLIEAYDHEELARQRRYNEDDWARVRTALRAYWGGLAYLLENLADEDWGCGGIHQETGPITIASRAQLSADHARMHSGQIKGIRGRLPPAQ